MVYGLVLHFLAELEETKSQESFMNNRMDYKIKG